MDSGKYVLIGALVAAAAGFCGTVIGGFITLKKDTLAFRREEGRRQKIERLIALRDLNKTLESWSALVTQIFAHAGLSIMKKKLENMDFMKLTDSMADMEYQIAIFAPELKSDFVAIADRFSQMSSIWLRVILSLSTEEKALAEFQECFKLATAVTTAMTAFRAKLIEYARKISTIAP
jgi:hypothetical protein